MIHHLLLLDCRVITYHLLQRQLSQSALQQPRAWPLDRQQCQGERNLEQDQAHIEGLSSKASDGQHLYKKNVLQSNVKGLSPSGGRLQEDNNSLCPSRMNTTFVKMAPAHIHQRFMLCVLFPPFTCYYCKGYGCSWDGCEDLATCHPS